MGEYLNTRELPTSFPDRLVLLKLRYRMRRARHSVQLHKSQDPVPPGPHGASPDRPGFSATSEEAAELRGVLLEAHAEDGEIRDIECQFES